MHLNILPKPWHILGCHQRNIQKNKSNCDIIMTITLGVNMITGQMTPFFSSTFCGRSAGRSFLRFRTFKIQFHRVPSLNYGLICKINVNMPKITRSSLLTYINLFYIKFANFWYITCFVPNLIPIWPRSHAL